MDILMAGEIADAARPSQNYHLIALHRRSFIHHKSV